MNVRVAIGAVTDFSETACVAVADGAAVAIRVGDDVNVFPNRCLHQDSPLEGGWVRNGVLSCPLHFWRYRVHDGGHIGTDRALERYPVTIIDDEVFVELPDPEQPRSLREQLLERARTYDRNEAFEQRTTGPIP